VKILLIGSGGREDALAWAIARSPRTRLLRCAPGNAGIARRAENVEIAVDDIEALVAHATSESYDLVVVGPEAPLVAGLADRLREAGIPVFGPSARAARIEGSKVFAKRFMERHAIPTGRAMVFDSFDEAERFLRSDEAFLPAVVKADGLAAGKGVLLVDDVEAAVAAAREMLADKRFGDAGSRILVEEMLHGREVSFFVLADGRDFVELPTCQDYKRAHDGGQGLNTGGMGCYSPSVYLDAEMRKQIVESGVRPTIDGMAAEGAPYHGVLYVGLMLTDDGPKVLEYNARFGDPETQVLMPRLDGDWVELLAACAAGRLGELTVSWRDEVAVCVVMAAEGYPGSYPKGRVISGIDESDSRNDAVVFHAGTSLDEEGRFTTSGGRVLGVTGIGGDLESAKNSAYQAVAGIGWDGEHHRTDIAADAIERTSGDGSA
jgi:phosphoribosylamine--glycine ligase